MKGKVKDAEDSAFAHLSAVAGDPEQAQRDAQAAAQRLDGEDRALARTRQLTAKDWWINPILALLVTFGFLRRRRGHHGPPTQPC